MKKLLGVLLLSALGVVGCKMKCTDASVDKAFTDLDPATVEALSQIKTGGDAQMCDEVSMGSDGREEAALVFSGSMGNAWKSIEDALLKAGWERTQQGTPPKPDDIFFQVIYRRKDRAKPYDGPALFLQLHWNKACKFGDVCARGHMG